MPNKPRTSDDLTYPEIAGMASTFFGFIELIAVFL
jgi:hypothetical protein